MKDPDPFKKLRKEYPFLTIVKYGDHEYIGIVQNSDKLFTSMFVYNLLRSEPDKQSYLKCGDIWWNESNRLIPISIFLKEPFKQFGYALRTFSNKELTVVHGPITSLQNLIQKRSKRRQITLVKKI